MKLSRRTDTDPDAILAHLDPQLAGARVIELGEGWDNVAYVVRPPTGADLVLRINKVTDPRERRRVTEKDVALLHLVARHATLAVSEVVAADPATGALLTTLVPGCDAERCPPARLDRAAVALGGFLTALHAIADEEATGIVEPDLPVGAWHEETERDFAAVRDRVSASDRALVEAYLDEPVPILPERLVFCHNDLGAEHVIVSESGREVTGVIDWSDAVWDDPARDVALLYLDFGPAFAHEVLAAYGGPVDDGFVSRARWFAANAGVAGVADRIRSGSDGVEETLARLRAVLDDRH